MNALNIIISFFAQKIFVNILNIEYLGLNGLFSNIISMLGIFELGIGSAIIFNLYKPLAKKDKKAISALMNFYKKAYRIIGITVLTIGLLLLPFLDFFIKEKPAINISIHVVYLFFIIDIFCSYLLSYKRSILYADQKNYKINIVHIISIFLLNTLQLLLLALTKNYYIYLIIKIIVRILENIAINLIVKKQYPFLKKYKSEKIKKTTQKDIFKKIRALFLHKIASFVVLGSDNILISKFFGLTSVGIYSNYYLIINAASQLVGQGISAITPSIGNKLAIQKSEDTYAIFSKIRFINFCFSSTVATCFMVTIQPFITKWLGDEYLFDISTVIVLSINMFQKLQRYTYASFKEAAGIFYEDRYVPIIEATLNIFASILLLNFFGINGIFIGTIISGLTLWCYSYPKFVYKKLFKRTYWKYFIETFGYILLFIITAIFSFKFTSTINTTNIIYKIILNILISVSISIIQILLLLTIKGIIHTQIHKK